MTKALFVNDGSRAVSVRLQNSEGTSHSNFVLKSGEEHVANLSPTGTWYCSQPGDVVIPACAHPLQLAAGEVVFLRATDPNSAVGAHRIDCALGTLTVVAHLPLQAVKVALTDSNPPIGFDVRWSDGRRTRHHVQNFRSIWTEGKELAIGGCHPFEHTEIPGNIKIEKRGNGAVYLVNQNGFQYGLATYAYTDCVGGSKPRQHIRNVVLPPHRGLAVVVEYHVSDDNFSRFDGVTITSSDPDYVRQEL